MGKQMDEAFGTKGAKIAPATEILNVEAQPVGTFDISLDEFCRRASSGKAGPELLGGFYQSQKAAGVIKSSEAAYFAALEAFKKQPA